MTLQNKKTFCRPEIFLSMLIAVTLLSSTITIVLPPAVAGIPTCLGDIDFDTFPDGTVPADFTRITTQYEPCGVSLFTTNDPGGPEIRSGFSSGSPPNLLAPTGLSFQFTGDIGIEFSSPVSGDVSVFAIEVRTGGLRLQAFDSANAVVDTFNINPSGVDKFLTMTVSGTDIVKVLISQIIPQTGGFVDGYAIDDLKFTAPTPEQAIQNLIDETTKIQLPKGLENSLLVKLGDIPELINDINTNNDVAACGKLDAFVNQVNALEDKKLTLDEAALLRGLVEDIKAALGC